MILCTQKLFSRRSGEHDQRAEKISFRQGASQVRVRTHLLVYWRVGSRKMPLSGLLAHWSSDSVRLLNSLRRDDDLSTIHTTYHAITAWLVL